MHETARYHRQTILPEIGATGQNHIASSRVLVVGAGGLGCPALQYLAAAGIGTIGIVDDDIVDITNLQRQILFTTDQQGMKKAEAAKNAIKALNPDITIHDHPIRLCADNALDLMDQYDIIIDGTDNFGAKFLINDAAVKLGKPVVYGSIMGFEGQSCVFDARRGACYRCLHPKAPTGHIPNCAEAGVIGALAGIVGSSQAMEAIRIACANPNIAPESGALWVIDARNMQTHHFNIPKNPDCPVCSKHPDEITLADDTPPVCATFAEITVTEAKKLESAVFIDVREHNEWEAGHIDGAFHLPLSEISAGKIPEHITAAMRNSDNRIIYCQSGIRSRTACELLADKGITGLRLLRGGYAAW